jgi:hypothetical protein
MTRKLLTMLAVLSMLAVLMIAGPTAQSNSVANAANPHAQRVLVHLKNGANQDALRADIANAGGKVVSDLSAVNLLVVSTSNPDFKKTIAKSPQVSVVASDHVTQLIRPEQQAEFLGKPFSASPQQTKVAITAPANVPKKGITPDPALSLPGLMWNIDRVLAPQAWSHPRGAGVPDVLVGVADTGLDYTHVDLVGKVVSVVDFTLSEDPPLCQTYYGAFSDADLAGLFGASADNDFNGHGSWIGGNIAGALNGTGVNGIVPNVGLVSLKISQWCGSAYDSTILSAFLYAADHGIDVVSISFGGYLDRTDPSQDAIYNDYVNVVNYARAKGTVIVAAAGNEHTRIGAGGQVISHGILDVPPGGTDYYGLWENPGGIPGVVDVAATGNVTNGSSPTCPADSLAAGNHQWCKPASDAHQPTGVGLQNQLTYYSNYGPRIDVAAPGGARKFNVPAADRGGTEGWPWTGLNSIYGGTSLADGYNAWEDFSLTSNYATQIPCVLFVGFPGFTDNQCYSSIQGTSMATPHVSAVLAIIASEIPGLRHKPDQLVNHLKTHTTPVSGNAMTAVSATDTSMMDRTGAACPGAFCHLGGPVISDADAYGAGLVNALGH